MGNGLTVETTPSATTDAELLNRYRSGDLESFGLLYDRHSAGLFSYARALTRDSALSEDLVQEAFVRLLGYPKGKLGPSVQAFLFAVIRNQIRDNFRREGVRRKHEAEVAKDVTVEARTPADAAMSRLTDLPSEQREVIALKIHGGLSFEQIGALIEIPTQTAASRYRYGLEKLAGLLSDEASHDS